MNKETKDVFWLLLLVVPMFVVVVFGWCYSPMYAEVKAEERQNIQKYLNESYFCPDPSIDRERMIKDFNFTDDEINPTGTLKKFIDETPPNQNLGASK